MAAFNTDEVFTMAIEMERSAARFYRRAAERHNEPSNVAFLTRLAGMEDEHDRIFTTMRKKETEGPARGADVFDPYGEGALYLDSLVEGSGAEGSRAARASLTGNESLDGILRIAVALEKQSILFYLGLKDLVIGEAGKQDVQKIIN